MMMHKTFKSFLLLICLALLPIGPSCAAEEAGNYPARVDCEGHYPGHLQGICLDDEKNVYWSFTTRLVKTDIHGKRIQELSVATHHGDLCYSEGKIYVAVNHGTFNDPEGKADSNVYVYDAKSLKELARHEVRQVKFGAGGIAESRGRFLVVGGLPDDFDENYVYEFDNEFRFIQKHTLASEHTHLGIQGVTHSEGIWWFACYGSQVLTADATLQMRSRHTFECGYGIVSLGGGEFYVARGSEVEGVEGKGHTGYLLLAVEDEASGLKTIESRNTNNRVTP